MLQAFLGLKTLGPINKQFYVVRSSDKLSHEISERTSKTAQLTRQHDALVVLWTMGGRVLKCQTVKRGKAAAVSHKDDLQCEFALIAHCSKLCCENKCLLNSPFSKLFLYIILVLA